MHNLVHGVNPEVVSTANDTWKNEWPAPQNPAPVPPLPPVPPAHPALLPAMPGAQSSSLDFLKKPPRPGPMVRAPPPAPPPEDDDDDDVFLDALDGS